MKKQIQDLYEVFEYDAQPVQPTRWQGREVKDRPEARMMEMLHVNFEAPIPTEHLHILRGEIQPNLPWADNHFEERVCGYPINPGVEWANWPFGAKAKESLDGDGLFNHNYMERYWPMRAGQVTKPTGTIAEWCELAASEWIDENLRPNRGIRHRYGDLAGLVRHLVAEPDTRQAYLPVWFPEDTGDAHNGRKPCTLGYHFIVRNGKMDVVYYLRSCDFANHFRDDIYLTVRLLLWILGEAFNQDRSTWATIRPGKIVVQITSLHMFINDFRKIYGPL